MAAVPIRNTFNKHIIIVIIVITMPNNVITIPIIIMMIITRSGKNKNPNFRSWGTIITRNQHNITNSDHIV